MFYSAYKRCPPPTPEYETPGKSITMDLHTPYPVITFLLISQFHYLARNPQGTSISISNERNGIYKPVSLSASPMLVISGCEGGAGAVSNANSIIQGAADNSSHVPERNCLCARWGFFCYHAGCEMSFREIRCDGFRNPANSQLTHSFPEEVQEQTMVSAIDCLDRSFVLPCKERKRNHAQRTWHYPPGGRIGSERRPHHCRWASLGHREQVETEHLKRIYRKADSMST